MITEKLLIDLVDKKFWKHINSETLLSIKNKNRLPREDFLKKLYKKIESMEYSPYPPRGHVISHKKNLVVRFIPALSLEDYCVYYYCLKSIEDSVAKNRVAGTFGGWSLGGTIRKQEDEEFVYGTSMPQSSFNKFKWVAAYGDFQKKAYQLYVNEKNKCFIYYDIANFYDTIRLDRLESIVREVVDDKKTQEVNLLFFFLSHWNKKYLNYEKQSVGLPQDEVGDCSRILANFYLQDYDRYISDLAIDKKSSYLRYADDQILAAPDEKIAKELMFLASKKLAGLGLNLNAYKARFFTRDEFFHHWSFDIFDLLKDKNDSARIDEALRLLKSKIEHKINFKPESALKKLLNCNLDICSKHVRDEVLSLTNTENFLKNAGSFYFERIYHFLDKIERVKFIKTLNDLSKDIWFNEFHLNVLRFSNKVNLDIKNFQILTNNLRRINLANNSKN